MKAVYTWDSNNLYIPSANKIVPDDYQLSGNETFDKPKDAQGHGLIMPIKRSGGQTGQWVGLTQEEYSKAHPAVPEQPSEDAQAMNQLGLQVATVMGQIKDLNKAVNELGLQFAKSQTDTKTENGGK
ncbi:hypothetical protein [Limosilactobacillus oris]|uniref:hypothetical protein n=1 Tax=Limosilactobacillus oris TaxID=1632 RepID=UPI00223637C7|nr:hypothetical protein [Limosilactobacillus oris]MCW4387543.1 hypothetical protein [Limosilactobacillus oris]